MSFENLDNEELLRLSLDAINGNRGAEAVSMLKLILSREPEHFYATYLLAAQHAQLQMFDRAEEGFRAAVAINPDFPISRFQLGQLLTMKGAADEVLPVLSPLFDNQQALGAYARGMAALAREDLDDCMRELDAGLAMPQEIPALEADMRRLRDNLHAAAAANDVTRATAATEPASAPVYFAGYGYGSAGNDE